jgi:hypothetical protein
MPVDQSGLAMLFFKFYSCLIGHSFVLYDLTLYVTHTMFATMCVCMSLVFFTFIPGCNSLSDSIRATCSYL